MKYSTAALLALVHGIVAMPWSVTQPKHSGSKVLSTNEDITLSIKVSQSPLRKEDHHVKAYDICWLLCASDEIQCPEDWGDCWTCCRNTD
ncbi:hypothetical protein NW762_008380 [Fusarium torreyae]|uniref:Uncharacterized protein n=1 Tax=Fusarium torreyae TaxID=1237075 RepID=A0A9W8VDL7_9HYPO|nr:hypothetical protein NW762_008380 [Fusarium torreyae]